MLTALLIAFQFPYQLILVPAFIIVFAVCLALMLRFPSSRKPVGGTLIVIGLIEALASVFLHSNWGFVIGFGIFIVGIGLTHSVSFGTPEKATLTSQKGCLCGSCHCGFSVRGADFRSSH